MPKYLLQVSYIGTKYSGSQYQKNTPMTIQGQIETAFTLIMPKSVNIQLTGSSRTDAGVHAEMNFFHFESHPINKDIIHNLNNILNKDISIDRIVEVSHEFHSRFDAISRSYKYQIHRKKSPFKNLTSYFYPYDVDTSLLNQCANIILNQTHFFPFSKAHTQTKTSICKIYDSRWEFAEDSLTYNISANRFLRGMIKGLVATMLRVARGKISIRDFETIFYQQTKSDLVVFDVMSVGLTLVQVHFPNREYM